MDNVIDRLIEVCNVKNVRQVDIRNIGGGSRPTISAAFTGRQKPNLDIIEALLKLVPGLNARWLITGKGKMFEEADLIENETYKEKHVPEEPDSSYGNKEVDIENIREKFNSVLDEFVQLRRENKELKNKLK